MSVFIPQSPKKRKPKLFFAKPGIYCRKHDQRNYAGWYRPEQHLYIGSCDDQYCAVHGRHLQTCLYRKHEHDIPSEWFHHSFVLHLNGYPHSKIIKRMVSGICNLIKTSLHSKARTRAIFHPQRNKWHIMFFTAYLPSPTAQSRAGLSAQPITARQKSRLGKYKLYDWSECLKLLISYLDHYNTSARIETPKFEWTSYKDWLGYCLDTSPWHNDWELPPVGWGYRARWGFREVKSLNLEN